MAEYVTVEHHNVDGSISTLTVTDLEKFSQAVGHAFMNVNYSFNWIPF